MAGLPRPPAARLALRAPVAAPHPLVGLGRVGVCDRSCSSGTNSGRPGRVLPGAVELQPRPLRPGVVQLRLRVVELRRRVAAPGRVGVCDRSGVARTNSVGRAQVRRAAGVWPPRRAPWLPDWSTRRWLPSPPCHNRVNRVPPGFPRSQCKKSPRQPPLRPLPPAPATPWRVRQSRLLCFR